MEEALERLQGQLTLLYRRALTRIYFFAQVCKAYESVLFRPLEGRLQPVKPKAAPDKKATVQRAEETSELDERVEAALQKAAKVWQGREPRPKPPAPRAPPAAAPKLPEVQPVLGRIQILIDPEAFQRLRSMKKAWRQHRLKLQSRISQASEASNQAQSSFLARLSALRPVPTPPTLVAQALAEHQLTEEIRNIVLDSDVSKMLATTRRNKGEWTLEDCIQLVTVSELGEWLDTQIGQLREAQAGRKVEEVMRIWANLRVGQSRRLSLEPQQALLTRLKGHKSSADIGKLLGCYAAWAQFRLQEEVCSSTESLPPATSLATLRLLHSLVVKHGAMLLTASLV